MTDIRPPPAFVPQSTLGAGRDGDPGVGWWWGNSCFLSCGKQEEISWATNICIDYWIWTSCKPHSGYDVPSVAKISAFNGLWSMMLLPDYKLLYRFPFYIQKIQKYGQRSILKFISTFIWFVQNYKKKHFFYWWWKSLHNNFSSPVITSWTVRSTLSLSSSRCTIDLVVIRKSSIGRLEQFLTWHNSI